MKKARLIITTACGRNCSYCCNTPALLKQAVPLRYQDLSVLHDCDEIMVTGGEPMRCMHLMNFMAWIRLEIAKPRAKLYLYSARCSNKLKFVLPMLNGFHFTVHATANAEEAIDLEAVQDCLREYKAYLREASAGERHISTRLSIVQGCEQHLKIDPLAWDEIKMTPCRDNCPLPEGETLYILNPELF